MSVPFCFLASLLVGLHFAFLLKVRAGVIFNTVDADLLNSAKLHSCAPLVLQTISALDRASCALACSLHLRCRAFLLSNPDRCELLSTPWRSLPSEGGAILMMRRLEHPSVTTWRFNGSQYILTQNTGTFSQMKAGCAARGMHMWYPNSQAEMRFVEQEILCNLPKETFWFVGFDTEEVVTFNIWIGVIDTPNGNCLLADGVTKCPVENYYPGQPNSDSQECTKYWWRNGSVSWDDSKCYRLRHGLCEMEMP